MKEEKDRPGQVRADYDTQILIGSLHNIIYGKNDTYLSSGNQPAYIHVFQ
jgi:hypothetical protein